MTKTHPSKDVMIAYANDCTLEIEGKSSLGEWVRVHNPSFNRTIEYRIKPEKHPDIIAAELRLEKAREALYAAQDAFAEAQDVLTRFS